MQVVRQSRDEIKAHIFKLYVNLLRIKGLAHFEPKMETFKRAIFVDEKYVFEKGTLKMWVEFTDPTNCTAILTYSFGNFRALSGIIPPQTRNLGPNTPVMSIASPLGVYMSSTHMFKYILSSVCFRSSYDLCQSLCRING